MAMNLFIYNNKLKCNTNSDHGTSICTDLLKAMLGNDYIKEYNRYLVDQADVDEVLDDVESNDDLIMAPRECHPTQQQVYCCQQQQQTSYCQWPFYQQPLFLQQQQAYYCQQQAYCCQPQQQTCYPQVYPQVSNQQVKQTCNQQGSNEQQNKSNQNL